MVTRDSKLMWQDEQRKKELRKQTLFASPVKAHADYIITKVAQFFKLNPFDVIGKRKAEYVLFPRYMAVGLIAELTGVKSEAMYFINRDRTSWTHNEEQIKLLLRDKYYKSAYEKLKSVCSDFTFKWQITPELESNIEIYQELKNQL